MPARSTGRTLISIDSVVAKSTYLNWLGHPAALGNRGNPLASHARENLHRIAHLEVEWNEELQGLAKLRFREANRDRWNCVGNRFLAEKTPLALITQHEMK